MRIVVAVGGNAIIRAGQEGTWPEQLENVREIAEAVLALRAQGHEVVLTHGNGPQVGALLLQNALGEREAAPLPLDALIAMTQGQIGYLLESAFAAIDASVPVAVLLTRVLVDPADDAFKPTRRSPSGRSTTRTRRAGAPTTLGWDVAPDAGRGWRRVVPSPHPLKVFGQEHVVALLERGSVVISCGGGGIPVAAADGEVVGVAGVIDKDRCSERLAVRDRGRRARAADRRAAGRARLRHALGARAVAADASTTSRAACTTATSRWGAWARRWSRPRASSRSAAAGR